ncbi:MAG: HAD family phosphatase [Rhizobiales bacterium]|nr:HAD family phosphatase [Hyphomicrobiales bacterium]
MPFRLVVFDMDDVLCHYDVEARLAGLASVTGRPVAAIRAAIWESDYFARADSGDWDAQGCLDEFSRRIGAPLTRAQWVATRRAAMTPFADMLALVQSLKERGAAVALLSNNDLLAKETLGEIFPGLAELFAPHAYVSAELGLAKPDPAIFRDVCARLGVAPREALFTDDLAENVEGARKAGLVAHLFRGRAGLETALAAGA